MSKIEVDNVVPQSGTNINLGESGDTVTVPAGVTLDTSNSTVTLPDGSVTNAKLANSAITINGSSVSLGGSTTIETGTSWQSSIVTGTTLSAVAGNGYWIDTTSNACTVTLPASASVGDTIEFTDYARTWGTNSITINTNGLNFQGNTSPNPVYNSNGQHVTIVYSGATQGWIPTVDDDVTLETPQNYSVDMLVIAGGASGGGEAGGGGGAGGYRTSTQNFNGGATYTITVGDGGAGVTTSNSGNAGSNSSVSGTGITTITSAGGGGGGYYAVNGNDGGSGGGAGGSNGLTGGSGNTPSTSPSQGNNGGNGVNNPGRKGGGGGGASAVGANGSTNAGNGGDGTASSITGSSVTRAGGGGGGTNNPGDNQGFGGSGGGGDGGHYSGGPASGTVNTGSGGGGIGSNPYTSGSGGKGVVILSMLDASYSGITTGSPTVATGVGGKTILTYTGSGSYTA